MNPKIQAYNNTPGIFFRICHREEDVFTHQSWLDGFHYELVDPEFGEVDDPDPRIEYLQGNSEEGWKYKGVCATEKIEEITDKIRSTLLYPEGVYRGEEHIVHILVLKGVKHCELLEEDGVLITPLELIDTFYIRYTDKEVEVYQ